MSEKVTDMIYQMLEYGSYDSDQEERDISKPSNEADQEGIQDLMAKLNALARFKKIAQTRKKENDKIVKLKSLSPNKNLPCGLLFKGSGAINAALNTFEDVRKNDLAMESMPTSKMEPGEPGKKDGRL